MTFVRGMVACTALCVGLWGAHHALMAALYPKPRPEPERTALVRRRPAQGPGTVEVELLPPVFVERTPSPRPGVAPSG